MDKCERFAGMSRHGDGPIWQCLRCDESWPRLEEGENPLPQVPGYDPERTRNYRPASCPIQ